MNDDELSRAIAESAKRGRQAVVPALGEDVREKLARDIARQLAPSRERAMRRRALARIGSVTGVLALAAAAVLFVGRTHGEAELPGYELALVGGARDVRGAEPAPASSPLRLRRGGDRFDAELTPPHAVAGPLAARAFLVSGARVLPFHGAVDVAATGAVRVSGTADDFEGVTPGTWELAVVVGRPDALAGAPTAVLGDGPGRQTRRASIVVE